MSEDPGNPSAPSLEQPSSESDQAKDLENERSKTRLKQRLSEGARRSSRLHSQFLDLRQSSLQQMASLIDLQIGAFQPEQATFKKILFDRQALVEFATGSVARCFGPEYLVYENRRSPRIPNGELMLMSRVVDIEGRRGEIKPPASIVTEFDMPADAWFYQGHASIPYSIVMEMALQPCGLLSAYLGTSLLYPQQDYYFRNLDGDAFLVTEPDLRGETVSCQSRLLSSVNNDVTIIQKFSFALSCRGRVFYRGESTFGYFTPEAMARQVGLDKGKEALPWINTTVGMPLTRIDLASPQSNPQFFAGDYGLGHGPLGFIQEALVSETGGRYQQGYAYARKAVDGNDWFYRCHFYQDPVMPGSLGIEAVLQAMQAYAIQYNLGGAFTAPRFSLPAGQAMVWKYRGQITASARLMALEIHMKRIVASPHQVLLEGEASVWSDRTRIYEVKNAAVCITDGAATFTG